MNSKVIYKKGISLITVIITVIIVIILANSIILSLKNNNTIKMAQDAKILNNITKMKEEIENYKINKYMQKQNIDINLYPLEKDDSGNFITMNDLSDSAKNKIKDDAKYHLYKIENQVEDNNDIPNFENIDYTKFYKLDEDEITSAKAFKDDLYMYIKNKNVYYVIRCIRSRIQRQHRI